MDALRLVAARVLVVVAALLVPVGVWAAVIAGVVQIVRHKVAQERQATDQKLMQEAETLDR